MKRLWLSGALVGICFLAGACVFIADRPHANDPHKVDRIDAPAKAHLRDGSVVIFAHGFTVRNNYLHGTHTFTSIRDYVPADKQYALAPEAVPYHNLTRDSIMMVDSVALDSVAFLEYYSQAMDPGIFLATAPGAAGATLGILKALFGSCPTIYTTDGERQQMEAECFSYSIAPRLEGNDLDRLDFGRPQDGMYSLRLTNEALETHYINQLQLQTVDHDSTVEAFPTPKEDVVLFSHPAEIQSARMLDGRDVLRELNTRDDVWMESDSTTIADLANGQKFTDGVELNVAVPPGARQMVVALRLRVTLMNTIFFYDMVIGSQGFDALNWMQPTLAQTFKMWRLYHWYSDRFGLKIQTFDGKRFRDQASIVDVGPIVWRQVAVKIPAPKTATARIRLVSLPGNWAMDWVGVSFDPPQTEKTHIIDALKVCSADGAEIAGVTDKISHKDKKYLVTYPGDDYRLTFALPPPEPGLARSYFVKSRGYYVEWIRSSWLAQARSDSAEPEFAIGTPVLRRTAQKWLTQRADFEHDFFASRLGAGRGGAK